MQFGRTRLGIFPVLVMIAFLNVPVMSGQGYVVADGSRHTISYSGAYIDCLVPADADGKWIYLKVSGGDGSNGTNADGGKGATVESYFRIGSSAYAIPVGSTIRFIVGEKGMQKERDGQKFGGGGGGTAVAVKRAGTNTWALQMVAGGGGGAGCTYGGYKPGREGQSSGNGSDGYKATDEDTDKYSNAGSNGQAGGSGDKAGGGGGSLGSAGGSGGKSGNNSNNEPVGGQGGANDGGAAGGFGYGGGGAGVRAVSHGTFGEEIDDHNGGGGGGYSGGGGGGNGGSGGGGGSYLQPGMQYLIKIERHGTTGTPEHGYVEYRISDFEPGTAAIRLAAEKQTKCIDNREAVTANGNNIQLWDCHDSPAQNWILDGLAIRSGIDANKCLDLDHSNYNNGGNVQLWDCNNTEAQKWIYEGTTRLFRLKHNQMKCLDLDMPEFPYNGTNVQLWDCAGLADQRWIVDGATIVTVSSTQNRIHYLKDTGICVNVKSGSTDNGANVQIYHCQDNDSQYWYFDGNAIRFNKDRNKCMDLSNSKIDNGTNIQLFDCNGTNAQKWTYDGITKAFRSWVAPDKCLDVDHSGTADHTNIQIYDCNGTDAQQFVIGQ